MDQEALWIAKSKEGDQKAFRSLYDLHLDPLFRFLRQFSADVSQVEEWVQRAFIKAYEHLEDFDGRSRFSSWLFKIGLNEMKTDRRRAKIVPFISLEHGEEPPGEFDPKEFEWDQTMRAWMQELDAAKRAVFILYEIEGYSHAEIADMLNIGESTSRTFLFRAKRYLKERWQQEVAQ